MDRQPELLRQTVLGNLPTILPFLYILSVARRILSGRGFITYQSCLLMQHLVLHPCETADATQKVGGQLQERSDLIAERQMPHTSTQQNRVLSSTTSGPADVGLSALFLQLSLEYGSMDEVASD